MTRKPASQQQPSQDSETGDWVEGTIQGGTMVLNLVKQAAQFAPLPFLKEAADLTLNLVSIAQAVRDNKKGFRELSSDSANLVAVFWRSYQGSEDKKKWLEQGEIRASARDLCRSLKSIIKLGEKMNSRNIFLRILYYLFDADAIKANRQKLNTAVSQFQVAAELDMHEMLAQITKGQHDLMDEMKKIDKSSSPQEDKSDTRRVVENEARARDWEVRIKDIKNAGIAIGAGDVVVENYSDDRSRPPPNIGAQNGPSADYQPEKHKSKNSRNGAARSVDIEGVSNSGIATGDGSVQVTNYR